MAAVPPPAEPTPSQALWKRLLAETSAPAAARLRQVAERDAARLADIFYATMMRDREATGLLEHSLVHSRLRGSLARWITTLFTSWDAERIDEVVALQRRVGSVHARVNVGIDLVMRGARVVREEVRAILIAEGRGPHFEEALWTAYTLVDLAVEEMAGAYVAASERAARAEEGYRHVASSTSLTLERERQRAALLEWRTRLLEAVLRGEAHAPLPRLGASPFGQWIDHKGRGLFRDSRDLESLLQIIEGVDETSLPIIQAALKARDAPEVQRLMRGLGNQLHQVEFIQSSLFERQMGAEGGRDMLTQALDRRFMPGILGREIDYCRKSGQPAAVLLVDVDRLEDVNDRHGHEAGDRALQAAAGIIFNHTRSGDFLFRYGGDEFLAVLVEAQPEQARGIAEKILAGAAQARVPLASGQSVGFTVGVGVAALDGHPDYEYLVQRAERALQAAKAAGPGRFSVAG